MGQATKKTDKLEVRLSPEVKRAFMVRCQVAGRSVSEVLRDLIEDGVSPVVRRPPRPAVRMASACIGFAALLAGGVYLASGAFAAIHPGLRLGLSTFLITQGVLYAVTGVWIVRAAWRSVAFSLMTLATVQLIYSAEVTPPASIVGTIWGVVFGGLGPTIILASACLTAWRFLAPP